MITIEAGIVHDPRRSARVPALSAALAAGGLAARVHTEGAGSGGPLRSFRAAVETAGRGATHLLLLEDDAEPCPGFAAAARRAAAARPLDALYLCATRDQAGDRMDAAGRRGLAWAAVADRICGTVAVVLPVGLARRCFLWLATGGEELCRAWHPETPEAFDCRLCEFLISVCGVAQMVSVWSLAGHGAALSDESLVRARSPSSSSSSSGPRYAYRPVRGVIGEDGYDTGPEAAGLAFDAAPEPRFNLSPAEFHHHPNDHPNDPVEAP